MPSPDSTDVTFQLPNLLNTVLPFSLKENPYHKAAEIKAYTWFDSYAVYTDHKREKFFSHDYGTLCAWAYPETSTQSHLETCIAFNLWLFAYDDMADESGLRQSADGLKLGGDISIQVLTDTDVAVPKFKFARMLQDFVEAFKVYTQASLCQTSYRVQANTPTIDEFIQIRRNSSGLKLVFAFIEYAMDLDIPDGIYNTPILNSLVEAAVDIVAWNNDICSFNNEQSHGDTQNLVYCVLVEKNYSLQAAMDYVAEMFLDLREAIPAFGLPDVEKYLKGLEHWISGSMHWYYHSKPIHLRMTGT
ncbi:terpenoid synthase [Mycena belliarum]|uniref:Terpene synthase n=1 Tax=Mycena belliarum TaxID=1033014 RepID=A0AAD6UEL7_9AGAR|nr:terpenoid synthase [Mycena belliae]